MIVPATPIPIHALRSAPVRKAILGHKCSAFNFQRRTHGIAWRENSLEIPIRVGNKDILTHFPANPSIPNFGPAFPYCWRFNASFLVRLSLPIYQPWVSRSSQRSERRHQVAFGLRPGASATGGGSWTDDWSRAVGYLWLSMIIYDYLWLSTTIYDYLDYLWLSLGLMFNFFLRQTWSKWRSQEGKRGLNMLE